MNSSASLIVDAYNVTTGGALVLLEYFVDRLREGKIAFRLIRNKAVSLPLAGASETVAMGSFDFVRRERTLHRWCADSRDTVLFCFGNFAPVLRKEARTVVYLHNPHLYSARGRSVWYKLAYFRLGIRNTDLFLLQTEHGRDRLCQVYNIPEKRTDILPFYDDRLIKAKLAAPRPKKKVAFVYNSLPYVHKNYDNLFAAWKILASRGLHPELHVTFPLDFFASVTPPPDLPNIVNHGLITHEETIDLLDSATVCIYPSVKESFGLGLIESAALGCTIIASDLPYVGQVVNNAVLFDPDDPQDIAAVVESYLRKPSDYPAATVRSANEVERMIDYLIESPS